MNQKQEKDESRRATQRATDQLYRYLQGRPVVRRKEIVALVGDQSKATELVRWLMESGKALSVRQGVYYLKRPQEWHMDAVLANPLVVAAHVHQKGVLGYHSALTCHGVAYSESSEFQVAVDKSVGRHLKPFEFQNAKFRFYWTDLSFGLTSSVVDDVRVGLFSRERILLEGLTYPDRFFGMGEFLNSVEGFTWLDFGELFELLEYYHKTSTSMRLGWLLERFKDRWSVSESVLRRLEKNRPECTILLIKRKSRGNRLAKRWKLMVPENLDRLSEV
jgi:predicted transcriptional regulator of viral defense system